MITVTSTEDSDLELRQACFKDLYLFYANYVSSYLYHDYCYAPHIDKLADELTKFHNNEFKYFCISMPPQHKLADSTPVLTPDGWKTHGELKVGDYVFGKDGKPTKIIGVSERSLCNKLVCFSNGSKILAHEGHLWSVYRRGQSDLKIIPTSNIENNFEYYESENGKKRYRFQLPLIKPLVFPEKRLPIDPYFLGYWLGDGSSTKPCITHHQNDNQFIDKVPYDISTQCIHKDTGVLTTYFSNQDIIQKLRELNLYNNKHIPQIYKETSIEQRLELLAGLIDSDGSVDKNERVRFVNVNKRLIDDFYELCVGLGLYPSLQKPVSPEKANSYKNEDTKIFSKKTSYCVAFQPTCFIPTTVPRKKIMGKGLRRKLSITNVETVEGEMGKCIEVSNSDGIYLVGYDLIPTHNSKSTMATVSYPLWSIFQNPDLDIKVITSDEKLALIMGDKLRECVRAFGDLFGVKLARDKKTVTYFKFEDLEGNRLRGSISIESGLGAGITGNKIDLLIIDDPYKDDVHEFTPKNLQLKIDWFEDKIIQRIRPQTKMIILHTRYHSNDLIGYLKENSSKYYHFLEMPVIKSDGSFLWPQNRDNVWLEFVKANTSNAGFQARYMQQPLDITTNFFKPKNLLDGRKYYFEEALENQYRCCRSWDLGYSDESYGDNRDYTEGFPLALDNNGNFYIYDFIHGQFGEHNEDIKKTVIPVVERDGFGVMQLLEFGLKKGASKTYYEVWDKEYLRDYPTQQSKPEGNKEIRATPFRDAINEGRVYNCIQNEELNKLFISQLESFPYSKHDDMVDACAYGFNYLSLTISPDVYAIGSFNVKDYTKTNMILRNILNE